VARGGVVDEDALYAALSEGRLAGAALDVVTDPGGRNPLAELDNVVLTPHIGSSTEATRRAMAMTAARNAVAALTGITPPNLINPEARK
jgi:phosphoglycerate dehydrogenase-like enzyme